MKIVAISDTHNKHKKVVIPKCDVLIHAGDATGQGLLSEVTNFLMWFKKQPATHKIFVPGNHDWLFDKDYALAKSLCDQHGIISLIDDEVVIDGIKFYGSPVTPWFCNWAFNKLGTDIIPYWDNIPNDVNVLITHGPSKGTLDTINDISDKPDYYWRPDFLGCPHLKNRMINLLNIRYHIHGHIHGSYGSALFDNKVVVHNVSICNEMYIPVNNPKEFIYNI